MRLIAKVPESQRKDSRINWLILEDDPSDTSGYFLFYHRSLDERSEYDSWHETKGLALAEAKTQLGVDEADWTVALRS